MKNEMFPVQLLFGGMSFCSFCLILSAALAEVKWNFRSLLPKIPFSLFARRYDIVLVGFGIFLCPLNQTWLPFLLIEGAGLIVYLFLFKPILVNLFLPSAQTRHLRFLIVRASLCSREDYQEKIINRITELFTEWLENLSFFLASDVDISLEEKWKSVRDYCKQYTHYLTLRYSKRKSTVELEELISKDLTLFLRKCVIHSLPNVKSAQELIYYIKKLMSLYYLLYDEKWYFVSGSIKDTITLELERRKEAGESWLQIADIKGTVNNLFNYHARIVLN